MRCLLDTDVISEPLKRSPDARVVAWLNDQSPLALHLSVLSLGELTMGVELASVGERRDELRTWVTQDVARYFVGRLLPVNEAVAREWGRMSAEGRTTGRELPAVDGLLLATARVYDLTLVTRNERDCSGRGIAILNPWTPKSPTP